MGWWKGKPSQFWRGGVPKYLSPGKRGRPSSPRPQTAPFQATGGEKAGKGELVGSGGQVPPQCNAPPVIPWGAGRAGKLRGERALPGARTGRPSRARPPPREWPVSPPQPENGRRTMRSRPGEKGRARPRSPPRAADGRRSGPGRRHHPGPARPLKPPPAPARPSLRPRGFPGPPPPPPPTLTRMAAGVRPPARSLPN